MILKENEDGIFIIKECENDVLTYIDEVLENIDKRDMYSKYIKYHHESNKNNDKKGYIYAKCPFCEASEKSYPFVINKKNWQWYCFRCGMKGGDIIDLIMSLEELSFSDSIILLAKEAQKSKKEIIIRDLIKEYPDIEEWVEWLQLFGSNKPISAYYQCDKEKAVTNILESFKNQEKQSSRVHTRRCSNLVNLKDDDYIPF